MDFTCNNLAGALSALAVLETETTGAVHAGIRAVRKWLEKNTESLSISEYNTPEKRAARIAELEKEMEELDGGSEEKLFNVVILPPGSDCMARPDE